MLEGYSDENSIDKGWAWVIMIGACLWNVAVSGTLKSAGVLYIELMDLFDTGPTETSWIGSTFCTMMLVLSPLSGYVGDQLPARWIIIIGGVVTATGVFMTGFAPTLIYAVVSYGVIAGGAVGIMDGPVFGTLNKYFKKRRAFANSIAFVGAGIGCLVMPIILTLSIELYSVRGTMFILSGVWLHVCVIGAIFRPIRFNNIYVKTIEVVKYDKKTPNQEKFNGDKVMEEENRYLESPTLNMINTYQNETFVKLNSENIKEAHCKCTKGTKTDRNNFVIIAIKDYLLFLKNPPMLRIFFAITFGSMAYFTQMFLFPAIAEEIGMSKMEGASILSILGIAEICSRIPLGYICDKPFVNKQLVVSSLSILTFIFAVIISFYPMRVVLYIYAGLLGTIGGTIIPLAMPILVETVTPNRISSAAGLFLCAMNIAFAIGPPISGAVKEWSGSFIHPYRLCIFMYIPCALLLLWNVVAGYLAERTSTNKKSINI